MHVPFTCETETITNIFAKKKEKTTAEVNRMLIICFQSGLLGIGFDFHIQNQNPNQNYYFLKTRPKNRTKSKKNLRTEIGTGTIWNLFILIGARSSSQKFKTAQG